MTKRVERPMWRDDHGRLRYAETGKRLHDPVNEERRRVSLPRLKFLEDAEVGERKDQK